MIRDFDIICISTTNWERPWGSRQQIMTRLAKHNRVLFVEYQMSLLHFLRYPGFLLSIFSPGLRKINKNIAVYRPLINLPFRYYSKTINLFNQWFLLLQLQWFIRRLGFHRILLWIFEPTAYSLVGRLNEQISIYHCIDLFRNEKKSVLRKRCIQDMEERLCRCCDILMVSTQELLEDKRGLNKNVFLIPSAVDESFLNLKDTSSLQSAGKFMEGIPRPRIGFVGTFDERVDYHLIEFISQERPDWSITLIGLPEEKSTIRNLKLRNNIYMIGWKDNNVLPAYVNYFDVCICPYIVNDFTKGVSSIKIFEYLALGKPVVTTDLPFFRHLHLTGLIKVVRNKEEFLRGIQEYLTNDEEVLRKARIDFSKQNTWEERVGRISEILENHVTPKNIDSD